MAQKPKDKKINDKHEVFCKEYLLDLNGAQAAIRAGYAADSARVTASKLLTDANILTRIKALMDERSENTMVDATFVVEGFKEVFNRCMQKQPVLEFDPIEKKLKQKVDDEGNSVWQFDSVGANKALEMLGKHLAMFTDKLKQDVKVTEIKADFGN
jgi:phage terminase small subunit